MALRGIASPPTLRVVEDTELDEREFFRRHAPYVARVGLRLLGRDADLDDLVQDVFVVAFRKRHQVREPEALLGWLATITVRMARRTLRRRQLRAMLGLGAKHEVNFPIDDSPSPEQRELLQRAYRVLDRIPLEHRIAWLLRHVDGRKLEDVAALCSCSLATAKRRIAAARTELQEALGDG